MPEINLIKSNTRHNFTATLSQGMKVTTYVVGFLVVLEILIYIGFVIYAKNLSKQALAVEQQSAELDFEIGKIDQERNEAISFQVRLKNLATLLDNHLYWTAVFKELESVTYTKAVFKSLQVDEGKHAITLSGTAPSYTDIAKLILGLKTSPKILDVTLLTSGLEQSSESGYAFILDVLFDSKILVQ